MLAFKPIRSFILLVILYILQISSISDVNSARRVLKLHVLKKEKKQQNMTSLHLPQFVRNFITSNANTTVFYEREPSNQIKSTDYKKSTLGQSILP